MMAIIKQYEKMVDSRLKLAGSNNNLSLTIAAKQEATEPGEKDITVSRQCELPDLS